MFKLALFNLILYTCTGISISIIKLAYFEFLRLLSSPIFRREAPWTKSYAPYSNWDTSHPLDPAPWRADNAPNLYK